ncbi:Putative major facilitator superfamily, MFS transporter superfamily [Septoria linicola]|uniref:Major facilitator superfamily, MFS transporter superfamily n=1 Tax=Septoria linicola TaxID=215465 RepID=A0A9Q9EGB1_9PEZI|nr:Putative major facilitator superfamily, MFS transporter superfamily [Septoria linicola]
MPLFAIFTLGAGFPQSVASLSVCRFLSGIFGSPGLSIGSATISDIWAPAERATPMAIYVLTPFLGPALGPLIGGFVAQAKGWRWTMWVLLMFTLVALLPAAFIHESYKAVLLKRRAKKRGLHYPGTERTVAQSAKLFLKSTLTRPVHMFCVEPVVTCMTTYVAINFGMLYAFFAAFPYVFETSYGFGLGSTGLTFLGLGVGVLIGGGIIIWFSRFVFQRQAAQLRKAGRDPKVPPENRLYIAMIGSVLLPCSLFMFGWSAQERVHWMCPIVAEALFGCGNLLIFMASVMYVMDFYEPLYGASAMGANNLARYTLGAGFPLFIVQMYSSLGIGWATSLLGFVSLALTPIPWVFYASGPRLRARSKYVKK